MKLQKIFPVIKQMIQLLFTLFLSKRGKGLLGYWEFNSQLLRDSEYVTKINQCISGTVEKLYLSGDSEDLLNVKLTCNDQLTF